MDTVNELSRSVVPITFLNPDGQPVTPASATVRIDDLRSGTVVRAVTAITPTASTYELEITAEENRIIDSTSSSERRRVTVTVPGETTAEYVYQVKNLGGLT